MVDHGWLSEMMVLHRFPAWLSATVEKLSKSWNTRVVTNTKQGRETSGPINFHKGLPQGDALCPRLFTICLNPVAWKISASEGYKLSEPTDLLYVDGLKIFASSECKLNRVMKSTKTAIGDIGLKCNPNKCAVVHVRRGVHTHDVSGLRLDDSARVPELEEGKHYKFLGVLESVIQEERLSLECAAKEYLRRMSVIWTSPLSDHNRVTVSTQFALPLLSYLMWTQHWPLTELRKIDREALKIIVENGNILVVLLPFCTCLERREVGVCVP